jgi:squalene synthase HpnC
MSTPATKPSLADAYARCTQLAREHYENFPVARLIPRHLRPHVSAVYAFARTADDLADEGYGASGPGEAERLAALQAMDEALHAIASGHQPDHPDTWIFIALADTIRRFDIPIQLFHDLLSAFSQDVTVRHYASHAELLDYCRRSANPIGRLVLLLHGHRHESWFAWSDAICTGLQLANFWQDVSVDWRKDQRVYVPREDQARHGVTPAMFDAASTPPALRTCLKEQVDRARALFAEGRPLAGALPFPLSWEIRLTWLGGSTILDKIEALDYDTVATRPVINSFDKGRLLLRSFFSIR